MSKKLAAQALDALLSSQSTISKKNTSTATSSTVLKKKTKRGKVQKDRLPATKTGLKKIKHELRYGHSVRRTQEEKESKENPLERLKSQQEKEQAIVERNLNYYKVTNRVSKKELELRKKATAAELIRTWTEALVPVCNHSLSHARQEVKWLLQHSKRMAVSSSALNARAEVRLHQGAKSHSGAVRSGSREGLTDKETELMQSYVDQRTKGRKPLQYILGTQPFMDLEILVRPPTLIPRWETEEWTSRLATILKSEPGLLQQNKDLSTLPLHHPRAFNILDLCSGSGCISLGLASALPTGSCNIIGVDIHPKAIELARENQIKNSPLLNQNRVLFRKADLQEPTAVDTFLSWLTEDQDKDHHDHSAAGTTHNNTSVKSSSIANAKLRSFAGYNLVVSNPPYIAHSEYETLEPEVALWEDPKALLADEEGLVFYPRIANLAMEVLHRQKQPSLLSRRINHPLQTPSSHSTSTTTSTTTTTTTTTTTSTTATATRTASDSDARLDPGTLERIYGDDDDNENNSGIDESVAERQWRNGPDMDKVRIPELVLEIGGDHQVESVTEAVRRAGFRRVEVPVGETRISSEVGDIAWTTTNDDMGQLPANGLVEGLDHIKDRVTRARAQVISLAAIGSCSLLLIQFFQCCNVALRKIYHMK
ncbi:hypothetical protein EC968_009070, partial [Mortierella alpina]